MDLGPPGTRPGGGHCVWAGVGLTAMAFRFARATMQWPLFLWHDRVGHCAGAGRPEPALRRSGWCPTEGAVAPGACPSPLQVGGSRLRGPRVLSQPLLRRARACRRTATAHTKPHAGEGGEAGAYIIIKKPYVWISSNYQVAETDISDRQFRKHTISRGPS